MLVGDYDCIRAYCICNEPSISLSSKFRLGIVNVLGIPMDPQHDFFIGIDYILSTCVMKKSTRDIVPHPLHQILGLPSCEQFIPYSVYTTDCSETAIVHYAVPESGADIEGVISVLGGYEYVRIDEVGGCGHCRSNPSREAYS